MTKHEKNKTPRSGDAFPSGIVSTTLSKGEIFSVPLYEDIQLLSKCLDESARKLGQAEFAEKISKWRVSCSAAHQESNSALYDTIQAEIRNLVRSREGIESARHLLNYLATRFHLMNRAEEREISRRNVQRKGTRPDSLDEAIRTLKDVFKYSFKQAWEVVRKTLFMPVWTAHPTQSKSDDVLRHVGRIGQLLDTLRDKPLTESERHEVGQELQTHVEQLYATEEHPKERKSVDDEHNQALFFLRNVVFKVIPRIYRDLRYTFESAYDEIAKFPPIIRFGSWFLGDRDGNDFVTPERSKAGLGKNAETILECYIEVLEDLKSQVTASLGTGSKDFSLRIEEILKSLRGELKRAGDLEKQFQFTPADFITKLELLRTSLVDAGFTSPPLLDGLVMQAMTFGFHFVSTDFRQHSELHEKAVNLLLPGYSDCSEEERVKKLHQAILSNDPIKTKPNLSNAEKDLLHKVLGAFDIILLLRKRDPAAVGTYIVSMTHDPSDLLEVLLLMKKSGLLSVKDGKIESLLDVSPLLETGEDLDAAYENAHTWFTDPVFRAHLDSRGYFEAMLGPSDSNKDVGFLGSTWKLHKASEAIGRACRANKIDNFCLFWGRGGTHARGGGRLYLAVRSTSPEAFNGRMKVTYQGEVISARQGDPDLAYRDLEQVCSAMILAGVEKKSGSQNKKAHEVLDFIAERSTNFYRETVFDPEFWPYYLSLTPFSYMQFLNNNARPVVRFGAKMEFENARAIPWNQGWIQTRINFSGWGGGGTGISEALKEGAVTVEELRDLYRNFLPFQIMIDTMQRELARTRLEISKRYSDGTANHDKFWNRIIDEFTRTQKAVLEITGQESLYVNSPLMQSYIEEMRNPDTDIVQLLQLELIREERHLRALGGDEEIKKADIIARELIPSSMNAQSAAMQATG